MGLKSIGVDIMTQPGLNIYRSTPFNMLKALAKFGSVRKVCYVYMCTLISAHRICWCVKFE